MRSIRTDTTTCTFTFPFCSVAVNLPCQRYFDPGMRLDPKGHSHEVFVSGMPAALSRTSDRACCQFPNLELNIWGSCLVKGGSIIPLAQSRPQ